MEIFVTQEHIKQGGGGREPGQFPLSGRILNDAPAGGRLKNCLRMVKPIYRVKSFKYCFESSNF